MIAFVIKSREEPNSIHVIDWIRLSMQYFHDCSYKKTSKFEVKQEQCIVFQDGKKYTLPSFIL